MKDPNQIRLKSLSNYSLCSPDNFTLEGGFESNVFNYVRLKIKKCVGSNCKSDAEIKEFFKNINFEIFIKTTKFVENQENNPT